MPIRDTGKPVPNVRGEEEDELQCLIRITEGISLSCLPDRGLLGRCEVAE